MKLIKRFSSLGWLPIYLMLISPFGLSQATDNLGSYVKLTTKMDSVRVGSTEQKLSALLLSTRFKHIADINQYLVSEKFDGVQGVWDGKQLRTRKGKRILVPDWFTADFPDYSIKGELWIGYGQFETISALVRLQSNSPASRELWKQVRFMVFEVPEHKGNFSERYDFMLQSIAAKSQSRLRQSGGNQSQQYIEVVPQVTISSIKALDTELNRVIDLGGEGLMLHKKQAYYGQSGLNSGSKHNIVKLKPYYDDEARVIGYKPGKGKFEGMMGALIVETDKGVRFSLGSGFTLSQRQSPPEIHSVVTFKYFGLTRKGTPRFASFLRVRFPAEPTNKP